MKVIIGLGNIGEKYEKTRHNVGFVVVDEVAKRFEVEFKEEDKFKSLVARAGEILLVKPQTFMNRSGEAVGAVARFYKVDLGEIVVVHDDLDIVIGEYKFQKGTGPKVHNGVDSVEAALGNKDFYRLRVGVDGRGGERSVSGEEYVLGKFRSEEVEVIKEVVVKVASELEEWSKR